MKKFFTLIAMMFAAGATTLAQDVEWGPNENPNSDCEGDDFTFVATKPNYINGEKNGNVFTGAEFAAVGITGEAGSKCISVLAQAGAADDWDSQFWICIPKDLEVNNKLRITFKYKADWSEDVLTADEEPIETITIGTQAHGAPGDYHHWQAIGDIPFTKEWQTFEAEMTISDSHYGSNGMHSIAFNLCQNNKDFDATFYFDDIEVYYEKENEEIIKFWSKTVQNGDFEGEDLTSFGTNVANGGGFGAKPVIEEGIGLDDTRGIKVVTAAGDNDWSQQFFISMDEKPNAGALLRLSFDVKAENEHGRNIGIQTQGPALGGYIGGLDGFAVTTEWQHITRNFSVSDDMASKEFQHIALCIAGTAENTIYFDNVYIEQQKEGSASDSPELIELGLAIQGAEASYGKLSDPANKELRQAFENAWENANETYNGMDADNAEQARKELVTAKNQFEASIKDYINLTTFIAWAETKQHMAEAMGESHTDLADKMSEAVGALYDALSEEAWTKAEINENTSKSAIMEMISNYIAENVQDGDDITILMENPSFAGNTSGWSNGGSKSLDYGPTNRNTLDMEDGKNGYLPTGMAEVWHGSFDGHQTITNLPAGLYTITCNAAQRGDDGSEETALLYAIVNGAETHKLVMSVYADPADEMLFDSDADPKWPSIETPEGEGWIPNGKGSANYHLNAVKADGTGYYVNTLNVLINEPADMQFGIKDTNTTGWCVMDNFKVIYHSMDNKLALAAAIEGLVEIAEGLEGLTDPADEAMYKAVKTAKDVVENIEATSKEEANAAFDALSAAIDDARANIKAWAACETEYWDHFSGIYEEYAENAMPAVIARADAANALYDNVSTLTTDEINEYIAEMKYLCEALLVPAEAAEATDDAPYDMTDAVLVAKGVDVDFENFASIGANADYPGWSGSKFGTGGGTAGPVGERWNQSNGFNTYVDIKGLPQGKYVLSCDGAYRTNLNDDWNRLNDETLTTNNEAFLYAKTSKETIQSALHNIAEGAMTEEQCADAGIDHSANCGSVNKTVETGEVDEEGNPITETIKLYCPDQLYTADQWIQAGYYKDNTVEIIVPENGELRIGVTRKGAANDWCFVDNFKLTYYGPAAEEDAIQTIVVKPATQGIYTISGVRVNSLNKSGLYIVNGKKVLVK